MTERLLTIADFADKVGESFTLTEEGVPEISLTLVECEPLKARFLPPNGRAPFSLVFTATTAQMLPQRLYTMSNGRLGTVSLFLVPIGKDERGFLHEALFN